MPPQYKIDMVEEMKKSLQERKNLIITDYRGLNVKQITDLRRELLNNGVVYSVVKNNLFKIALKDNSIEGLDEFLFGPTAIAFSEDDLISPAKILFKFAKDNKELKIKGGYTEGQVLKANDVEVYSNLPSFEESLSSIIGGLKSPLYGLLTVMQGPIRQLAMCLSQLAQGEGTKQLNAE